MSQNTPGMLPNHHAFESPKNSTSREATFCATLLYRHRMGSVFPLPECVKYIFFLHESGLRDEQRCEAHGRVCTLAVENCRYLRQSGTMPQRLGEIPDQNVAAADSSVSMLGMHAPAD